MENASKALIMAAGVLIGLMILGALILMFSNLSSYQNTNTQNEREAQIAQFNAQYENYNRKDIRGSDLLSLMNKIVDYNTRKGDGTEENYQSMTIEVSDIDKSQFQFDEPSTPNKIQSNYKTNDVKALTKRIKEIENKYTIDKISTLVKNIANITDRDKDKAEKEIKKIIKNSKYPNDEIIKDTLEYYQYTQLKRAHFNCTGVEYNEKTGRIIKMKFECTNKFS